MMLCGLLSNLLWYEPMIFLSLATLLNPIRQKRVQAPPSVECIYERPFPGVCACIFLPEMVFTRAFSLHFNISFVNTNVRKLR
jgi:hypothetical protein